MSEILQLLVFCAVVFVKSLMVLWLLLPVSGCVFVVSLEKRILSFVGGNICNLLLNWCSGSNTFSTVVLFWGEKGKGMRHSLI